MNEIARELYRQIENLPLVCPHGHVDPRLFAEPDYRFGSPVDLLIIPDHYVFRMLFSQGIPLEALGIPRVDGGEVEHDHRKIWHTVANHWHLFRGTPTGIWIQDELREVFGIHDPLNSATAMDIYDRIAAQLAQADFTPRRLFERFNIEVLATTDAATNTLAHHQAIRQSGWQGRVIPTFRPDGVVNIDDPAWRANIDVLSKVSGISVTNFAKYNQALENRRVFFKLMGATATDHGTETPFTAHLSEVEAEAIFQRALAGNATAEDAARFTGHMLIEMARMSVDDGLAMQLHVGSYRNHNAGLLQQFGRDKGADIPVQAEFTRNLRPLLNAYGSDPRLRLILFTLDEAAYSRELAPLAGHYPAVLLGPPWWFHDSYNGMRRYFDQVMETAGLYNTAGFNDDTRAFPSIPARHRVWRRASAAWLSGLVEAQLIDMNEARSMAQDLAYGLAKRAYRLA
jgi:glucuronate isomerase